AHPRLGDHRRQRLAEDGTLGRPRGALLEWCEGVLAAVRDGAPELAPPYAVRHLAEHLEDAGAGAAALLELVDPAWQAAWEAAVDDFNGFAGDVARAQRAARREAAARVAAAECSEAAAAAVRCAIVEAGVTDVTTLISGE